MVIGRVGQGFTGGALIPTAMTIIATRLPRSQQPIGNALFGVTAILGPVLGPLVGGWLTENISWHYARSEEHTSELQSLMRISYAVFCLKKKNNQHQKPYNNT